MENELTDILAVTEKEKVLVAKGYEDIYVIWGDLSPLQKEVVLGRLKAQYRIRHLGEEVVKN